MTENKRYYRDFSGDCGTIIKDRTTDEEVFEFGISDSKDLCNLLNEQDERIKELEQTIDTISKDYEESHGMDIRNAEWFTAW